MLKFRSTQFCALAISVCLVCLPMMRSASAAIISTETAIEMSERQDRIDHINSMLTKESVHSALVQYGVDPDDASSRVDALTDSELQTLERRLENLPAGGTGIVEVIGIVAIVLIILELLDVTNFFNEF